MRTHSPLSPSLAALLLLAGTAARAEDDAVAVARRVAQSIHLVDAGGDVGSGFHYRERGVVVTNRHVLDGVPVGATVRLRAVIERDDGFTDLGPPLEATVRYKHPDLDLAILLAPELTGDPLRAAELARDRLPPRGTRVWIHGFPSTLSPTISAGLLAGHHREWADGTVYLLTDAALASGSSGGPATDAAGDVIGIATAVYDVPEEFGFNWGYLLPVRELERLLDASGGVAGLPSTVTPAEVAEAVRTAGGARAGATALMDGLHTLALQSGSLRELATALQELALQAIPQLRLESPDDCVALNAAGLAMVRTLAERGVRLGLRADETETLDASLVETASAVFTQTIAARVAMAQVLAPAGAQSSVLLPVAEATARALEDAVAQAERSCAMVQAFAEADELVARALDHDAVLAAMTDVAAALALLEAAGARLPPDAPPIRDLDAAARERYERAIVAIEAAEARWSALPAACRSFDWLDPFAAIAPSLEEIVERLGESGLAVRRESTFVVPAGGQHTIRVRLAAGTAQAAFVAGAADGVDIDMHVYAPDGTLLDLDAEPDGVPVVFVENPAPGAHRVVVSNLSDAAVEVRFVELD